MEYVPALNILSSGPATDPGPILVSSQFTFSGREEKISIGRPHPRCQATTGRQTKKAITLWCNFELHSGCFLVKVITYVPGGNFLAFVNLGLRSNLEKERFVGGVLNDDTLGIGHAAMVEHAVTPVEARTVVTRLLKGFGIVEQLPDGRAHDSLRG